MLKHLKETDGLLAGSGTRVLFLVGPEERAIDKLSQNLVHTLGAVNETCYRPRIHEELRERQHGFLDDSAAITLVSHSLRQKIGKWVIVLGLPHTESQSSILMEALRNTAFHVICLQPNGRRQEIRESGSPTENGYLDNFLQNTMPAVRTIERTNSLRVTKVDLCLDPQGQLMSIFRSVGFSKLHQVRRVFDNKDHPATRRILRISEQPTMFRFIPNREVVEANMRIRGHQSPQVV